MNVINNVVENTTKKKKKFNLKTSKEPLKKVVSKI